MGAQRKYKLSYREIAERFKVSPQAVMKWAKAGCPMDTFEEVESWRSNAAKDTLTLTDAKRKKTLLECERLETIVKREHGELISRDTVRESGVKAGAILSAEARAMSNDLPAQLLGLPDENAVRIVLDRRLNLMLSKFQEALVI